VLLLRREELLSPDIDRSRRAQVAEIVDRQLEQLQAAANELREVARHSELASTDRGVDLAQLIEVAVRRVRPLAGWSRVAVEAQAPDVPVTVAGDRNGLETAIANLLDNAVKYTPPGGTVVARCQPGERAVTVEIVDDGPGISEEERAAVLRPWSRGRSANGVRGSGLGLSLVIDVASALGGSFDLAPNPGGGTIARLVIPV
jgi:signal transduction histidine kinase